MSRVLAGLERFLNGVGAVLVVVILVAVCAQIVMRYVFNNATMWSDPVASAAMAWLTFIAMTAAVRSDSNMSVRFAWNRLGERGKRIAEIITLIMSAGFAIALAVSSWQLMQVTDTALVEGLPFEMTWAQMYSIAFVTSILIVIFAAERVLRLRAGDNP